jgi:5-formyltetrahydrofolate cyclo-ligase
MRFYRAFSAAPEKGWETGAFNIREPEAAEVFRPSRSPFLVVTPGLAFDRNGGRLGRGRAFYDRFFAELNAGGTVPDTGGAASATYAACGICLRCQLVDHVPTDARDKPMDAVFTG